MKRLLTSLLLLLLGCSAARAQERAIDEATYNREMRAAGEYRLTENYRVRTTTTSKSGPATSAIHEYELPGPKRHVTVFRVDRNETVPSSEWIYIGQKIYVKRPGLAWQIEEQAQANNISPKTGVAKAEYRDFGIEPQESMRVLQRTVRAQLAFGDELIENVQTVKSWIDRSGRLRKEEYISTNPKSGSTVLTMEYEVDPTIRIEPPIKQ